MFIISEGMDGSGKTTQSKLLKKYLGKHGCSVVLTKEPTDDSSVSQKIRQILNKEVVAGAKNATNYLFKTEKGIYS